MRKLLLGCVVFGLCAYAQAATWWVARNGLTSGGCATKPTACTFQFVKGKAIAAGDHIVLTDGNTAGGHGTTYTGAANMLDCLSGCSWDGATGNEIVIEAENARDASGWYVEIDGENVRNPIRLWNQHHVIVQNISGVRTDVNDNFSVCSIGGAAPTGSQSHHNQFINVNCHDQGLEGKGHAIIVAFSADDKIIDSTAFGANRKCLEMQNSDRTEVRRMLCVNAGSLSTSGPDGIDCCYSSADVVIQDSIIMVTGSKMPASYRSTGNFGCQSCNPSPDKAWSGSPQYSCTVGGCNTATQYNGVYVSGAYMLGHLSGDGQNGGKLLGNIMIGKQTDYDNMDRGIRVNNFDNMTISDNIVSFSGSLYSPSVGLHLQNCSTNCTSPVNLVNSNNTVYTAGATKTTIASQWTTTNMHTANARTTEDHYQGSHAAVGATVCYLYENGVLTSTARWNAYTSLPAMMEAMNDAGYTPINLVAEAQAILGAPPAACGGVGGSTPTNTPTHTATNTATRTFTASNTPTRSNTPTNTATRTFTPSATHTATFTPSRTFTPSAPTDTPTRTFTPSLTFTRTNTATNTPQSTNTMTRTNTPTAGPSPTPQGVVDSGAHHHNCQGGVVILHSHGVPEGNPTHTHPNCGPNY